ncbi:hypothetical protein EBH_0000820 [Eimeria brunetti]|uniref:Uncharacterized protein n=1 Tax=Eimeria brunetti TaxID=51314 RepID=U6LSC3_9EIME|nr:hypothetical protein EBH_0000820 [Eimeria brunetti]
MPQLDKPHLQPALLVLTSPSQNTARGGRRLLQRGPRSSRKLFAGAAVAAVVSILMLVTVFAVCRARHQRSLAGAAAHRSLSYTEGDSDDLSSILDQCLDLQEERGLQLPVYDSVDEREAKERLVAMLHASAAEFEQRRALVSSQSVQSKGRLALRGASQRMDASSMHLPLMAASVGPSGAAVAPVAGRPAEGVVSFSPEKVLDGDTIFASHAHSLASYSRAEAGTDGVSAVDGDGDDGDDDASARPLVGSPLGSPGNASVAALSPDAWLTDLPTDEFPPAVQKSTNAADSSAAATGDKGAASGGCRPSMASKQMDGKQHFEAVSVAASGVPASAGLVQTTSSSRDNMQGCFDDQDLTSHPFVRLPTVKPEDVLRCFRPECALTEDFKILTPMYSYTELRVLFAKPTLNAEEVEKLIFEAENLANYAKDKLTRPANKRKPSFLFKKLSSLFMLFDHLVCARKILGDKMLAHRWWDEFASKFETEFRLPSSASMEKTRLLNRHVNRLSVALSIYKKGDRPPPAEVIELKRLILTQQCKGSQLTHPLWKLWLKDDNQFLRPRDCSRKRPYDHQTHGERTKSGTP